MGRKLRCILPISNTRLIGNLLSSMASHQRSTSIGHQHPLLVDSVGTRGTLVIGKHPVCRRPSVQPPPLQRVNALHIDRRAHLERAWKEQKDAEAWPAPGMEASSSTAEVTTLAQLERVVQEAGSEIVVVAFYSRSCGACKQMLQMYRAKCQEAWRQKAGVRFLEHNIRDEFDDITGIARLYRIKSVPSVVFFCGGAKMKSMPMPDSRMDPHSIRWLIGSQSGRLDTALRQMLFEETPSARR